MWFAGCFGAGSSSKEPLCEPRSPQWDSECPRVLLRDYYLHAPVATLAITNASKISLSVDLLAWSYADVTISDILALGGRQVNNSRLDFNGGKFPILIPQGELKRLRFLSVDPVHPSARDLFIGLKIFYTDSRNGDAPHELAIFNRCYALEGRNVRFVESIKGRQNETIDCLSKNYLLKGEVSDAALMHHEFGSTRHAFPALENDRFWQSMEPVNMASG